jgi:CheY-like chemotaxis protein
MLAFLLNKKQISQVDFAEDGQKCVDIVKSNGPQHYHLIFMDNTMPVMVRFLASTFSFLSVIVFISVSIQLERY